MEIVTGKSFAIMRNVTGMMEIVKDMRTVIVILFY
jgi:hypothetical protein